MIGLVERHGRSIHLLLMILVWLLLMILLTSGLLWSHTSHRSVLVSPVSSALTYARTVGDAQTHIAERRCVARL